MLFSAPIPSAQFSLHSCEAKSYFPVVNSPSAPYCAQNIANGDQNKLKRSNSSRNSINATKNSGNHKKMSTFKHDANVSTSSSFVKTLTGRLNLGTEYLKETVQKAFNATHDNSNKSSIPLKNNIDKYKKSNTKLYTLPPSVFHKQVEKYRADECSSVDNLNKEMCYFRPIRLAPVSPWKSGSNIPRRGVILMPKTISGSFKKGDVQPTANNLLKRINLRDSITLPSHSSAFVRTAKIKQSDEQVLMEDFMQKELPIGKQKRNIKRKNNNTIETERKMKNQKKSYATNNHPASQKLNNKQDQKKSMKNNVEKMEKKNFPNISKTKKKQNVQQISSSPPLTRSRLREMPKSNLTNALIHTGRYI